MKSRGRPKVPGGRVRQHLLQVRLSDKEYETINETARQLDTTAANLVRSAILDRKIKLPKSYSVTINSKQYRLEEDEAVSLLRQLAAQL